MLVEVAAPSKNDGKNFGKIFRCSCFWVGKKGHDSRLRVARHTADRFTHEGASHPMRAVALNSPRHLRQQGQRTDRCQADNDVNDPVEDGRGPKDG